MAFAEWAAQFITWSNEVVGAWGYLGIFLVSLVGNASIILPVPSFIIVFTFGAILNPWLVGLAGALGATIGEPSMVSSLFYLYSQQLLYQVILLVHSQEWLSTM